MLEKTVVGIFVHGMIDDLWILREDEITASDNRKEFRWRIHLTLRKRETEQRELTAAMMLMVILCMLQL